VLVTQLELVNRLFFRKKKEVKPEVLSEETCCSCGNVGTRGFEEGDNVFGSGKRCVKCSSTDTMISAIYGVYPPDQSEGSRR
jgi:hypothetical protein